MRVAAIIPNWNGAPLLRRLFPTVLSQTPAFDSVVVVDNGSSDDSVQVAERFGARVVRLETNRGFALAVNAGFRHVDSDAVAILNNDVELQPGWLDRLCRRLADESLTDESIAFAAGKTVSASDPQMLDGTFDAMCTGGCALRCGAARRDGPYWQTSRTIQLAPFTAVLIRSNVFRALNGLDELFESYLEDVDFGLRCAALGYKGVYEPTAVASHAGSATFGSWNPRIVEKVSRNQVLLVARHYDSAMLWRYGWSIFISQLLWGLVAMRRGGARAWLRGKLQGLSLFSSARRPGGARIAEVLSESERLILDVQLETGFDLYWRLYFALTFTSTAPR